MLAPVPVVNGTGADRAILEAAQPLGLFALLQ